MKLNRRLFGSDALRTDAQQVKSKHKTQVLE